MSSRPLFAALLAAVAALAVSVTPALAHTAPKPAPRVLYNSTPSPAPGSLPSDGVEAYSFNQLGDEIQFGRHGRTLNTVTVGFTDWACESGQWNLSTCVSDPGATFEVPVTLNLYRWAPAQPSGEVVPGALLKTVTRTFLMPYRPTMSIKCVQMGQSGEWYDKAEGVCHNGLYHTVTFQLKSLHMKLPQRIVYGVSYNSDNHGPAPLGGTNSPADSLNLSFSPAVTKGKQVFPGGIFWDTSYAGFTCADPTNGIGSLSPFQTGVFNLDGPCNGTPNSWQGLVPAIKVTSVS
jgi:hypothetical protein